VLQKDETKEGAEKQGGSVIPRLHARGIYHANTLLRPPCLGRL